MKHVGDETTLTRKFGPEIPVGSVLETKTGRQYIVLEVQGRKLFCVVVSDRHKPRQLKADMLWTWAPR